MKIKAAMVAMLLTTTAHAETCALRYNVLVNGAPAMREVAANVKLGGSTLHALHAHRGELELPCGKVYELQVTINPISKSVFFETVGNTSNKTVTSVVVEF